MANGITDKIEKILGRELEQPEKERFQRIKEILQIADNDALWDVLIAMEYQRTYYEALPEKISNTTSKIFDDLGQAAEKEVAIAQSKLADSVVEQANRLSKSVHLKTWLVWGLAMLAILLMYGSLTMWAGYCIGAGKSQPPIYLLKMPVGVLAGMASLFAGSYLGVLAGKSYSEGKLNLRREVLPATGCLLLGAMICAVTLAL